MAGDGDGDELLSVPYPRDLEGQIRGSRSVVPNRMPMSANINRIISLSMSMI